MTAVTTELEVWRIGGLATRADAFYVNPASTAEFLAFWIFRLALWALHVDPPSRGLARYTSEGMLIYI